MGKYKQRNKRTLLFIKKRITLLLLSPCISRSSPLLKEERYVKLRRNERNEESQSPIKYFQTISWSPTSTPKASKTERPTSLAENLSAEIAKVIYMKVVGMVKLDSIETEMDCMPKEYTKPQVVFFRGRSIAHREIDQKHKNSS